MERKQGEHELPPVKRQRTSPPELNGGSHRHSVDGHKNYSFSGTKSQFSISSVPTEDNSADNGEDRNNNGNQYLMICEASSRDDISSDSSSMAGMAETELTLMEDFSIRMASYRGPADVSHNMHTGPCQPTNVNFPPRAFGRDSRSFKQEWYLRHPWLEYSVAMDGAFCYVCRVFAPPGEQAKDAFTNTGFRNWKRAMERKSGLRQHERGEFHQRAFSRWMTFCQLTNQNAFMEDQQSNSHLSAAMNNNNNSDSSPMRAIGQCAYNAESLTLQRYGNAAQSSQRMLMHSTVSATRPLEPKIKSELNKKFAKTVLEAYMFVTKETTSFHSGQTYISEINAILQLISKHDEQLHICLRRGIDPFMYEEARRLVSNAIRAEICNRVRHFSSFSLMFVDCRDKNSNQLIAFCLRFLHEGKVRHSFFGYQPISVLTDEETLITHINMLLNEHELSLKNCIGQTYDEASVLTLKFPRMQLALSQFAPQALPYRSRNYSLEMLLSRAARDTPQMAIFVSVLRDLCTFFASNFAKDIDNFSVQPGEADPAQSLTTLLVELESFPLSACLTIRSSFTSVVRILSSLAQDSTAEDLFLWARRLLLQINVDFVFALLTISRLADELLPPCRKAQDPGSSPHSFLDLLKIIKGILGRFVSSEIVNPLCEEVGKIKELLAKSLESNNNNKEFVTPAFFTESVNPAALSSRIPMIRQYVESMNNEVEQYFKQDFKSLIQAMDTFNPKSKNFLNQDLLNGIAKCYSSNESDLENEMKQLKRFCDRQKEKGDYSKTLEELVENMTPFQTAFYESFKLMQIVMTLTSQEAQPNTADFIGKLRAFFRNNVSNEELSDLSLSCLEKQSALRVNLDSIARAFSEKSSQRFYKS